MCKWILIMGLMFVPRALLAQGGLQISDSPQTLPEGAKLKDGTNEKVDPNQAKGQLQITDGAAPVKKPTCKKGKKTVVAKDKKQCQKQGGKWSDK